MRRVSLLTSRLDVNYLVVPMFHIYGALGSMVNLVQGVKIILENRFDLISLFQQIEKHKVRLIILDVLSKKTQLCCFFCKK